MTIRLLVLFISPVVVLLSVLGGRATADGSATEIEARKDTLVLRAGILERTIDAAGNLAVTKLAVAGQDVLARPGSEVKLRFRRAQPNREPVGLKEEQCRESGSDADQESVRWVAPVTVHADRWADLFKIVDTKVAEPKPGVRQLTVTAQANRSTWLHGVRVVLFYEVYDDHPAIRKWVRVTNGGENWLMIDRLVLDGVTLADDFAHATLLTPSERGAASSIIAFGTADRSSGIIAVSEIPSALRAMGPRGAMGYTPEPFRWVLGPPEISDWQATISRMSPPARFQWVLGPSENFTSEPVFHYAYDGEVRSTISSVSTPLDRTVERPFKQFLTSHVGLVADTSPIYAPLWSSWTNFGPRINDAIVRTRADIAARAGFKIIELDCGWQRDLLGTEVDTGKFPDFKATCRYARSKGLDIGLWVSCFRTPGSKDLAAMPQTRSLPVVPHTDPLWREFGSMGMSFASPWRRYYANDLVRLAEDYGAVYFKQDFTNIRFGDIAAGHESRTRAESLLRGLRGLLEAQDLVRRRARRVAMQVTHEIYWGTPGVPCDVAVLKHAPLYHIPPNDYSGAGPVRTRYSAGADEWDLDPAEMRRELLRGCHNARQRLYAHRGLPLHCIEYYGAATINIRGSLTSQVQDRQVCSWLMGIPSVFAGDLISLTEENIAHYRRRFDLLGRLDRDYGIYRHFQYSGVPGPSDTGWHWWGKLNDDGYGAVVVLRGSDGEPERSINVPWALPNHKYRLVGLFSGTDFGIFTGRQLQQGAVTLALPRWGQEILELAPAAPFGKTGFRATGNVEARALSNRLDLDYPGMEAIKAAVEHKVDNARALAWLSTRISPPE